MVICGGSIRNRHATTGLQCGPHTRGVMPETQVTSRLPQGLPAFPIHVVFKALLGCPTSTWNACPAPNSSSHCLNLFFPHYASLSRCPSSPGQAAKTSPLAPTQERQPCPDRRASSPALTWAASSSLWPLHWWSHLLPPSWLVFLFFGLLSFESISYSASRWSIRKYSPKRNLDVTFPDEKARSWHSSA